MSRSLSEKRREALPPFGTLIRVPEPDDESGFEKVLKRRPKMRRNVTSFSVRETKSQAEKEESNDDGGVWFLVNKNGFPVDDVTWSRMWDHVAKIHPDGVKMTRSVRGNADLPQVN